MTCGARYNGIPSGLINLGATCYFNCLFQYFHSNNLFCNEIFKIPSDLSEVIYGIQHLLRYFINLIKVH